MRLVLASRHRRAVAPLLLVSALSMALPIVALAAPGLRRAEVVVAFSTHTACEVSLTVEVTGTSSVEHRLEVLAGAQVELLEVRDARLTTEPHDVGRTKALVVAPAVADGAYTLRYRVAQSAGSPYRCPLWLPTAPADGRSRNVRLAVTVPEGATASGTMPGFAWTGTHGTATLPHLPAVVIVPFAAVGEARPWDISRAMDVTALATLAGSTVWWLRRRRTGTR